jgi:16S rRNA (guanine527-N7)-methyltransferase
MTYQQFKTICGQHNIDLTNEQFDKFQQYYNYLVEENSKYNLTAITDESDVYYKHFLDSILGVGLLLDNSTVLDIGCGAGFPSIPLKIMNDTLRFTLLDSVGKKVNFVDKLSHDILQLSNVETIHARCEDLAKTPKYRAKFDIVVARAVAPLNVLIEYCIPMLKIGGKCIFYKSKAVEEEIKQANNAMRLLKCKLIDRIDYRIKEIDSDRSIIVIEKFDVTPNQYPRLQNKARKNPL